MFSFLTESGGTQFWRGTAFTTLHYYSFNSNVYHFICIEYKFKYFEKWFSTKPLKQKLQMKSYPEQIHNIKQIKNGLGLSSLAPNSEGTFAEHA